MNNVEQKKQELRHKYILIREQITEKIEKSKIITSKIMENETFKNAKLIGIYKSLKSEVNTDELIKQSISNGKEVALPRVENNELQFYKITSLNDKLIKSKFGVEEPTKNIEKRVNKNDIDLIIVPGLCFDNEKNRLGFGKGYYDRFLKNSNLKTIAICFKEQIVQDTTIPITKNDVKMQQIITD